MKFFTLFDKPLPVGTACNTPSLTVQSEKAQCDINAIIARYKKTGVIDHVKRDEPLYADCEAAITDLERANALVAATDDAFWSLDSSVRDRIGEPSNLPSWIMANREEAEKFGFVAPVAVQTQTPPVEASAPSAPSAEEQTANS